MVLRTISTAKKAATKNIRALAGERLTESILVFGDMAIGTDSLILSIDQYPQTNMILRIVEVLCYPALECTICLGFQHTEAGKIRGRPVLLIKSS